MSAHGIVAAASEFLGPPSPRAFNLFQEGKPDLQEIGASLPCSPCGIPDDMVRPSPHGRQHRTIWLRTGFSIRVVQA